MALIECDECGKEVSDKAKACPNCGAPINVEDEVLSSFKTQKVIIQSAKKSRSLAVLLALFLGGLGIHKFYLNQPGTGMIYLLLCWTFIPIILGFIEAIMYLFMSEENFQLEYT